MLLKKIRSEFAVRALNFFGFNSKKILWGVQGWQHSTCKSSKQSLFNISLLITFCFIILIQWSFHRVTIFYNCLSYFIRQPSIDALYPKGQHLCAFDERNLINMNIYMNLLTAYQVSTDKFLQLARNIYRAQSPIPYNIKLVVPMVIQVYKHFSSWICPACILLRQLSLWCKYKCFDWKAMGIKKLRFLLFKFKSRHVTQRNISHFLHAFYACQSILG